MEVADNTDMPERAPKTWNTTRRIGGRLAAAGVGNKAARIMIISVAAQEAELEEVTTMHYGQQLKSPAKCLKGPAGAILKDVIRYSGIQEDAYYYTNFVKWLPERGRRTNPRKPDLDFWSEVLASEIDEVKPDIIVCMGKPVFDHLYPLKFAKRDLDGGFFRPPGKPYLLYPTDAPSVLVSKPETYGRMALDFQEVARMEKMISGAPADQVPLNYSVIRNSHELKSWVSHMASEGFKLFSVDCEWGGRNFIDGKLRSIQFTWAIGCAVFVRFMDDQGNYVFDVSYEEAGKIMGAWMNRKDILYAGHHSAADTPWMRHVLKLDTYEKFFIDTEFALACCDEFADLGLERLALAYSDLGKYDVDLQVWKKMNKQAHDAGYAFIPDDILIPYAMKDTDVVFRAIQPLLRYMEREGVAEYYFSIFHPFVTDVFSEFSYRGLPMDIQRMDELRTVLQTATGLMGSQLRVDIAKEARVLLWNQFYGRYHTKLVAGLNDAFFALENILQEGDVDGGVALISQFGSAEDTQALRVYCEHFVAAKTFNIRSTPDMIRWLYKIKGYTPVKSTKGDDHPAVPWERVLEMPADRQKQYNPAVDRQSLEILAARETDKLLLQLLDLNATGNLCKAFLKEAEFDEDGEIVKENGLHYWLASDGCVHGQMSATETGRPRAWQPNCLNWPSFVRKQISTGVERCLKRAIAEGVIMPDGVEAGWLKNKIPSVRSCVRARPGRVFVESDYATAELRAWAYISGDEDFIRLLEVPDSDFGMVIVPGEDEPVNIRLKYSEFSGIDKAFWQSDILMTWTEDGEVKGRYTLDDLIKDEHGNIAHPKTDLHWVLAEMVHQKPRELLNKKRDRGAAKTGNFCIAAGELVLTHRGLKPIEKVLDCDLLWDGMEWVSHEGVVHSGRKRVIEYQGIRATDRHEVWVLRDGKEEKVPLGEVRLQRLEIIRSAEHRSASVSALHGEDHSRDSALRSVGRGDSAEACEQPFCWSEETDVYDIINAGPRNRFTCQGLLVSNSTAYGAVERTLERKIEQDTGIRPEPGTGAKILQVLKETRRVAFEYMDEIEKAPLHPGYVRAASGRKRRFALHPATVAGISSRIRQSALSSQGREARNFPMQESVASTAARAAVWLLRRYRQLGLDAWPMIVLYDSVVTDCEYEDRELVSQLHQEMMTDKNTWNYHGRTLKYPIDTELNTRWSTKTSQQELSRQALNSNQNYVSSI